LHCDNHVLAVAKPAGQPTVPDESGDESLFDVAKEWVRVEFGKPGQAWLGVVHRLDRPVSGVVCFARTSKAAARLSASLRSGECRKLYWGVTEAGPLAQSGELEQWLVKDEAKNRVRVVGGPGAGARLARTRWTVCERAGGRLLVALEPLSGRAHQLRIGMATLGLPLLGDLKYGARRPLPDQSIALHARSLWLPSPVRGTDGVCDLDLAAPPPRCDPWDSFAAARSARARN
jgi:23S rRNA pseudouridine1911/1915/1917 synthase